MQPSAMLLASLLTALGAAPALTVAGAPAATSASVPTGLGDST